MPDSGSIDVRSYRAVQLMGTYLYEAASGNQHLIVPPLQDVLSRRELQCLELAAQGKTDWEVGKLLGISQWTVHRHIESAKRRLGVTTRVQAIVQALVTRQASFGDVIRADYEGKVATRKKGSPRHGAATKATRHGRSSSDNH